MPQRVVIVSESAKTRETLAQVVRDRGGKPFLSESVDEAQRVLETVPADVVLLETRRVDIRARRHLHALGAGPARVPRRPDHELRRSPPVPRSAPVRLRRLPHRRGLASEHPRAAEFRDGRLPGDRGRPRLRRARADRRRPRRASRARRPALSRILASHDAPRARRWPTSWRSPRELVREVVLASLLKDIGKAAVDPALAPTTQDAGGRADRSPARARPRGRPPPRAHHVPVERAARDPPPSRALRRPRLPRRTERAARSRWARGSSPSSTPTSPCARPVRTARAEHGSKRSESSSGTPASSSTRRSSRR